MPTSRCSLTAPTAWMDSGSRPLAAAGKGETHRLLGLLPCDPYDAQFMLARADELEQNPASTVLSVCYSSA